MLISALFVLILQNLTFLCSLGKELQRVLEKLNIKRLMEAVNNGDAEGIDELWGVSCKISHTLIFFGTKLQSSFLLNHVNFI